ncbi:sugar O-acetyltransferase [Gilliamella sp. wkB178]|uniref:sugar O-acetyltransferase n=1 Tax=Gilliamella sp. wkB178 TaxID=3120259 RepID=UPI0009BC9D19|nr:sugar O-acetyltransferase [Gilliamella apicola]
MTFDEMLNIMRSGQMYNDLSPTLIEARRQAVLLTNQYNSLYAQDDNKRYAILEKLFKSVGENVLLEPNFRCEFGFNIAIGDNFYANFDCIILDAANVEIGNNVLFAPKVGIYTANHAINAEERAAGGCYAKPVKIGDRVWVGAGVHINQGVSIGDNTIIGSGSVVTKDIPANVIAAGVPCKVLRQITDADKTAYLADIKNTY